MRKIIEDLLHCSWNNKNVFERFQNGGFNIQNSQFPEITNKNAFAVILSFIIVELLVLVLGKYIWNNVVVDMVTFARPIRNIWQLLGLSILIKLITN